jgi:hypothetical protein
MAIVVADATARAAIVAVAAADGSALSAVSVTNARMPSAAVAT